MVNLPGDWRFRESKLDPDRLGRVLTPISAVDLLNLLLDQIDTPEFRWKKGDLEARGNHRAEFRVPCSPGACDTFFSGVSGVRAQYYRGIAEGEELTRYLITRLADTLMSNARGHIEAAGTPLGKVRASLAGASAKIWIDEDASSLDRTGVDAETLITIEIPHWVKAAREASAAIAARRHPRPRSKEKALLGVQVPKCNGIGIFGAWLRDQDGAEFRVPSKRNRERHIRAYGFS